MNVHEAGGNALTLHVEAPAINAVGLVNEGHEAAADSSLQVEGRRVAKKVK